MEDEYFHKFKKSLDHQRDFEFDEADWNRISNQLDAESSSLWTKLFSWKYLATGTILLLLTSNVFLWRHLSQSQSALWSKLNEVPQRDTLIIEKRYTVMDTVIERVNAPRHKSPKLIPYFFYPQIFHNALSVLDNKFTFGDSSFVATEVSKPKAHYYGTWVGNQLPIRSFKPIAFLRTKPKLSLKTSYLIEMNTGPSKIQRVGYYVRPKGVFVGGDLLFSLPIGQSFKQDENTGLGLRIEVPFTNQVSFWTVVSGHFSEYSSDYILNDFEQDVEISSNTEFVDLKIIQKYKRFMVGLKYDFSQHKKWNPYFSVGFGAARKLRTEVIYDLVDKSTGLPIRIEKQRPVEDFEIKNLFEMGLGINYQYNNRLHFQTGIGYVLISNSENVYYKSALNFGSGILYNF